MQSKVLKPAINWHDACLYLKGRNQDDIREYSNRQYGEKLKLIIPCIKRAYRLKRGFK